MDFLGRDRLPTNHEFGQVRRGVTHTGEIAQEEGIATRAREDQVEAFQADQLVREQLPGHLRIHRHLGDLAQPGAAPEPHAGAVRLVMLAVCGPVSFSVGLGRLETLTMPWSMMQACPNTACGHLDQVYFDFPGYLPPPHGLTLTYTCPRCGSTNIAPLTKCTQEDEIPPNSTVAVTQTS